MQKLSKDLFQIGIGIKNEKFFINIVLFLGKWQKIMSFPKTRASLEFIAREEARTKALMRFYPPTKPEECQSYVDFYSGKSPVALKR
jgi:hypothetical protein